MSKKKGKSTQKKVDPYKGRTVEMQDAATPHEWLTILGEVTGLNLFK